MKFISTPKVFLLLNSNPRRPNILLSEKDHGSQDPQAYSSPHGSHILMQTLWQLLEFLHFWNDHVLEGIGNIIGWYIKTDIQLLEEIIYTSARIRVEVDIRKGLPESVLMIHKYKNWLQPLEYENTAFRCRIFRQKLTLTKHMS